MSPGGSAAGSAERSAVQQSPAGQHDGRAAAAALPLALVAGAAIALQAFVNGRLGGRVGSPLVAALLSFAIGLVTVLVLTVATGSLARTWRRLADGARPRWWYLIGGLCGAFLVTVSATAAPKIGVALLTVGIVAGQVSGSLAVDAIGLGPLGRRPATGTRLVGAALAVAAVVLSAVGQKSSPQVGLVLLVLLAGAAVAFQQAANGQLQRVAGESLSAATVNFLVGTAGLALAVLVAQPHVRGWSAPAVDWIGGVLGVFFVTVAAATVRRLGVLLLTLAGVAGQSVGALVIDGVVPATGRHLTPEVIAGVVLTLVAVLVGRR